MAGPRTKSPQPLSIGLLVVGSEMVGFTVFGVLLDYFFGSMPWATVALTLAGAAAAMIHLRQMVVKRFAPPAPPPPPPG